MAKIRIILSVPSFFPYSFGGGQVYVYRLAKELKQRGHIVTIVTSAPLEKGNDECAVRNYQYDGLSVKSIRFITAGI